MAWDLDCRRVSRRIAVVWTRGWVCTSIIVTKLNLFRYPLSLRDFFQHVLWYRI